MIADHVIFGRADLLEKSIEEEEVIARFCSETARSFDEVSAINREIWQKGSVHLGYEFFHRDLGGRQDIILTGRSGMGIGHEADPVLFRKNDIVDQDMRNTLLIGVEYVSFFHKVCEERAERQQNDDKNDPLRGE